MRKGAGISALSRHTTTTSSFTALSTTISITNTETLNASLQSFKESLMEFARSHKEDIKSDPGFRFQFQKMCSAIGVDPLSGSFEHDKHWSVLGLGDVYYQVCVQLVDVCISTKSSNGGMIDLVDLTSRINRMRGLGTENGIEDSGKSKNKGRVEEQDVLKAIELLKPLHAGYTIVKNGTKTYIRSVPRELDLDQSTLLSLAAEQGGRLIPSNVKRSTGWNDVRTMTALEDSVMREGMGWVDEQGSSGEKEVWLIAAISFAEA